MIRAAKMEDAEKIDELFFKSMPSPWKKADIESAISSPTMSAWVLENDRKIVCAILLQVCLDEAEILSIATDPAERRKGYGKELLDYVLRELGPSENIFLEVRSKNQPAICFYETMGFEVYGMRKKYYNRPADDAILMKIRKI